MDRIDNDWYGTNGLPAISSQITIQGNGATIQRSGGAPKFRIFGVYSGGDLTLKDLTVTNGRLAYGGDRKSVV